MKKFQLYFFILFIILIGKCFGANTAVTVNGSGQVVNGGSITFTNLITIGALQYPLLDGTSNYVMTTDGAGHLSLQAQSGGGGGGDAFLANNQTFTGSNTFNSFVFFGNGSSVNQGTADGFFITNTDVRADTLTVKNFLDLNGVFYDAGVVKSLDVKNRIAIDNTGSTNLDWQNKTLFGLWTIGGNVYPTNTIGLNEIMIGDGSGGFTYTNSYGGDVFLNVANDFQQPQYIPSITFNTDKSLTIYADGNENLFVTTTNDSHTINLGHYVSQDNNFDTFLPGLMIHNIYGGYGYITVDNSGSLRLVGGTDLYLNTTNGTTYINAMKFPSTDGSSNQVLTTHGDMNMYWETPTGGGGGGDAFLANNQTFTGTNTFSTLIIGNGPGITNMNASSLLFGTIPTARYGAEVILTNTSPLSIGTGSSATTDGIAIGNYNVSSSAKSVAVGYSNTVAGTTSGIGVGFGNVTAGARGIAIGLLNTSAGSSGIGRNVAIGVSCVSTQNSSVAVGVSCNATNGGIAVGNSSAANGSSMVFGNSSFASGTSAISLGTSANSTNAGSMVVSTTTLYSSNDNQFASLFTGGYKFLGGSIEGNGSGLTALNATQLTSGTIPTARYGAEVVQTNDSVYVNAVTNVFSGSGISVSTSGRNRTLSIDGTIGVTNVVSGTNQLVVIANRVATINSTADLRHVGVSVDGGGSAITTGVKGDIPIPCNGVLKGWTILLDQSGSIVFDVWTNSIGAAAAPTVAGTITASAKPTVTSAVRAQSFTLTGWGVNVTTNMALRFNVDSATTTTRANLTLIIERNQP